MKKWLSKEEQYQEVLNNEQIERIKDQELREIRRRHLEYLTSIFLDEQNISDQELMQLEKADREKEKREIEAYKRRKLI